MPHQQAQATAVSDLDSSIREMVVAAGCRSPSRTEVVEISRFVVDVRDGLWLDNDMTTEQITWAKVGQFTWTADHYGNDVEVWLDDNGYWGWRVMWNGGDRGWADTMEDAKAEATSMTYRLAPAPRRRHALLGPLPVRARRTAPAGVPRWPRRRGCGWHSVRRRDVGLVPDTATDAEARRFCARSSPRSSRNAKAHRGRHARQDGRLARLA